MVLFAPAHRFAGRHATARLPSILVAGVVDIALPMARLVGAKIGAAGGAV